MKNIALLAVLSLLLDGCAAPAAEFQICGMQPMGNTDSGLLIVRMHCESEESNGTN